MFTLRFKKSKSKNYPLVEKLAHKFSEHTFDAGINTIKISLKELFEKWDYFNLMFWRSVDWEGTTFGYDGFDLHSHCDKTSIFYALQLAHTKWIVLSEQYLSSVAPLYYNKGLENELRTTTFNEKDTNYIIDLILAEKACNDYYNEFGYLNFKAPLRNSDFFGRRLAREEKKKAMENEKINELNN